MLADIHTIYYFPLASMQEKVIFVMLSKNSYLLQCTFIFQQCSLLIFHLSRKYLDVRYCLFLLSTHIKMRNHIEIKSYEENTNILYYFIELIFLVLKYYLLLQIYELLIETTAVRIGSNEKESYFLSGPSLPKTPIPLVRA